jgi:hypothetical protein
LVAGRRILLLLLLLLLRRSMLFVRRMLLADLSKSVSSGRLAHTAMDVGN